MAGPELLDRASMELKAAGLKLDPVRFNTAVVGTTGVGKSSLISGLMMLQAVRAGDPGAASLPACQPAACLSCLHTHIHGSNGAHTLPYMRGRQDGSCNAVQIIS